MSRVLIVAFHFPPLGGGSGLLRILKFCRYLPECGWQPIVLTANPRAYERLDESLLAEIAPEVSVDRAFALDAQKHLAIRGRYIRWLALPDRWASWILGAVPAGWNLMRRKRVDLLVSTFPIATAVLIGLILHKLSGKPWVVDFRDPMTEEDFPRDPSIRRMWIWIEKLAVQHSSLLTFTSRSAMQDYLRRYPKLQPARCRVIPNGYDEEDFQNLTFYEPSRQSVCRPVRLLHAGVIYPEERDPRPFFKALGRLKREGLISNSSLKIDLRASGSEDFYSSVLRELAIEDLVNLLPSMPYRESLQDAASADALLLFQAANCNHQIPAKTYEYLRLGKPILALTSQAGDTGALLREAKGATIVDLDDEQAIYMTLPGFLQMLKNASHSLPDKAFARRYARRNQAHELARCFDRVIQSEGAR